MDRISNLEKWKCTDKDDTDEARCEHLYGGAWEEPYSCAHPYVVPDEDGDTYIRCMSSCPKKIEEVLK